MMHDELSLKRGSQWLFGFTESAMCDGETSQIIQVSYSVSPIP